MAAEHINGDVVTKSEFAEICGVSKGRVSQWISEGKIDDGALVGEGPRARINVGEARTQLDQRLDISQRLGNGAATNIGPGKTPSAGGSIEDQIKRQKLEQIQRSNRRALEDERNRSGVYMLTVDARVETAKVAAAILAAFDGGMSDIANAMSAKFELPNRDVLHLLRQEFKRLRQATSDRLIAQAQQADPLVADDDTKT